MRTGRAPEYKINDHHNFFPILRRELESYVIDIEYFAPSINQFYRFKYMGPV